MKNSINSSINIDSGIKSPPDEGSYRNILRSTSLIGGASIFSLLIGMVRTKFVAVLLGPAGVGLLGTLSQITLLVGSITGMGIETSGVRQIAESVGAKDQERLARTVITVRRVVWATGLLGVIAMVLFSKVLSKLTFDSADYTSAIAILGITLLFTALSAGQSCLLRGTRRIADVAKSKILGALFGTAVSIPCFYLWGLKGIVPALIGTALGTLIASWLYSRRVSLLSVKMSWQESKDDAKKIVMLGVSLMGASLATQLTGYMIKITLIRELGIADLGLYQAAFNMSGALVIFVLGAMGTDYYPRLTAVSHDHKQVYKMVNDQTHISILLALPGLVAMVLFAPLIIKLFYSDSFVGSISILRLCTLGVLGRVFSWPLGFILLAKGQGKLFFTTEVLFGLLHFVLVYFLVNAWGLIGAGIAFVTLYTFYTPALLIIMKKNIGESWTKETFLMMLASASVLITVTYASTFENSFPTSWVVKVLILSLITLISFSQLSKRSGINVQTILKKFGKR